MVRTTLFTALCLCLLGAAATAEDIRATRVFEVGEEYYAVTVDEDIEIRVSSDLVTWRPHERISLAAKPVPGSRVALGIFGGRRHLYYCRLDGSIAHLVTRKTNEGPGNERWKDDGRVVESGSSPSVVVDAGGAAWLCYQSGSEVDVVGLGTETGRIARPLRTAEGVPPGPFCVFRRGEEAWILRSGGRWLLARRLDAKAGDPWIRSGFIHPGFEFAGVVRNATALATSGPEGLAYRPLLWLPDGGPAVDDSGTLTAWTGDAPGPEVVPGPWLHSVDDQHPTWVTFRPGGEFGDTTSTWQLDGDRLTMRWPRADAPGGVWIDRCLVSAAGTRYLGRNQHGMLIRGFTTGADWSLRHDQPAHPLVRLPEIVTAPEGKLSLFVDYADIRGEAVVAYLVNRGPEKILLPTQDGNPVILLEGKAEDGTWERAQSHQWSWCGNSYMVHPVLPPDHFFRLLVRYPGNGEEREVRYRSHHLLELVSNGGTGRVDPNAIRVCLTDRITIDEGTFGQVREIALGDRDILAKDFIDLRMRAIERLLTFDPAKWRPVMGILVDDPDPKIRKLAQEKLR